MEMKKLAVFFPGIGYTVDKPLMHYCRRIAAVCGYEILLLPYEGFPENVKGDREKMRACFQIALEQAEKRLAGVDLAACEDILFVGKSVGTVVAASIAEKSTAADRIRQILYTPVDDTFRFLNEKSDAIVFTGGKDPWVGGRDSHIPDLCAERSIPCHVIPDANHSLESGDVLEDIRNLKKIMKKTGKYIKMK